ncbi:hypothetical protein F4780DRAFT_774200 [Xylariomycetidae sp. FL0641]|nr:hypothetical protein F4780DRAFT_774200 [Xylariomycetidae sp. FL0641]
MQSRLAIFLMGTALWFCAHAGDFMKSCYWPGLDLVDTHWGLNASCWGHGPLQCTTLDIDRCFAYEDGPESQIVCSDEGHFQTAPKPNHCTECKLDKTTLSCTCGVGGERVRECRIDLNDYIWDDGGSLRCFDHLGVVHDCPKHAPGFHAPGHSLGAGLSGPTAA